MEQKPSLIDLAKLPKGTSFTLTTHETRPELESRLRREEADAEHQRKKDLMIVRGVMIAVGLVCVACVAVVLIPGVPPENAKWATTLLTTIVSAGLGYATGKSSK
jgi:hypothetical protein